MQLKQLLYLVTVAETQSIRKASHKLFVSQQAISQSLKNMENEYNIHLVNRSVHGITLTEHGKYVVSIATEILALNEKLENYFALQSVVPKNDSLDIAAIHTAKNYILPEISIKHMKYYPHVQLNIFPTDTDEVISSISTNKMAIGFLGMVYIDGKSFLSLPQNIRFTPLVRYEYCVTIGCHSPLAHYKTLSVKSILEHPIIFLTEQLHGSLEKYLPYRVLSQFGTVKAVLADSAKLYGELIVENMGIGISSDGIFEESAYIGTTVKPLRDNIYGYFGYIMRNSQDNLTKIDQFLNIVHEKFSVFRDIK